MRYDPAKFFLLIRARFKESPNTNTLRDLSFVVVTNMASYKYTISTSGGILTGPRIEAPEDARFFDDRDGELLAVTDERIPSAALDTIFDKRDMHNLSDGRFV